MNPYDYSYHLNGRSHASQLGQKAEEQHKYRRLQSSKVGYQKYQNAQSTKVIKKSKNDITYCSMCNKRQYTDHIHCKICKICVRDPVSFEQHMTGNPHAKKVLQQSNDRKQRGEFTKEMSSVSPSKSSSSEDKKNLLGFAWVRCKRLGCGFTGMKLEADTLRHQTESYNGGGMEFFNIFCRICTHPDHVTQTSEVFDDASDFESHMKQCHQEEHVNLLNMKESKMLAKVSNFVSHMRQKCHQEHVD